MRSMIGKEIFHYTDLEALAAIVTKQALWATHAQFLNDSEELRYAHTACCRYMEGRIREYRDRDEKLIVALLELTVQELRSNEMHNFPYVLSFTTEKDQLSQWRGYGKFGQGVSVGFEFDDSTWRVADDQGIHLGTVLYRCLYCEKKQNLLFQAIIDAQLKLLAKQRAEEWKRHLDEWADWLVNHLLRTFPYIKCPAFQEENEVRLAVAPEKMCWERKFKVSNGILVPYIEIHEENVRLPITRVVVGPSAKQELIVGGVRRLLDAHEYNKVPVERSAVPFRG